MQMVIMYKGGVVVIVKESLLVHETKYTIKHKYQ